MIVALFSVDKYFTFNYRDSMDEMILVSGSQIVMAAALVLGIVATFTLVYKLCGVSNIKYDFNCLLFFYW